MGETFPVGSEFLTHQIRCNVNYSKDRFNSSIFVVLSYHIDKKMMFTMTVITIACHELLLLRCLLLRYVCLYVFQRAKKGGNPMFKKCVGTLYSQCAKKYLQRIIYV